MRIGVVGDFDTVKARKQISLFFSLIGNKEVEVVLDADNLIAYEEAVDCGFRVVSTKDLDRIDLMVKLGEYTGATIDLMVCVGCLGCGM
jgi:hypothetical protein